MLGVKKKIGSAKSLISKKKTDNEIQFILQNFCFKSVKKGDFSNYLKNNEQFAEKIGNFFHGFFKYYEGKSTNEIFTTYPHVHLLEKKQDILCKEILKFYVEKGHNFNGLDIENSEYYELGFKEGLRVIGKRYGNIFELLFLDLHHLLYPNVKYNQEDYKKYKLCMLELKDEKLEVEEYERLQKENEELREISKYFENEICLNCKNLVEQFDK